MAKFGGGHRSAAVVGLLAFAFGGGACKKMSESLIVVGVTAPRAAPELTTVSISVSPVSGSGAAVTQTFAVANGLSTTTTTLGVYISSDVTGEIAVHVTSRDASGGCAGYVGNAGPLAQTGSVTRTDVALVPGDLCGADAGATGGSSGAGGTSGSGGATDAGAAGGTPGTPGTGGAGGRVDAGSVGGTSGAMDAGADTAGPNDAGDGGATIVLPSLAHCTEYVHNMNPTAACVSGAAATDVEISAVAFTPDGKYFFSAGEDARVKVWTVNGKTLAAEGTVLGAIPGFTSLAVSADSKLVAVGAPGGQLNVWNVANGWPIAGALTGVAGDLSAIAFGPDNTLYAIDNLKNFYIYTMADLAPKSSTVLADFGFEIATSPRESEGTSGLGLGSVGGKGALQSVSATALGAAAPFAVSPKVSGIYALVFSPNGRLVASGSDDGSFGIWSVPLPAPPEPNTPRIALSTDFVWNAAFHSSSAYIAIAAGSTLANRQLAIWNVATGAMQSAVSLTALTNQPRSVTFSPTGAALVTGERNCGKILVCVD
jgi:hypothetical protein